MKPETDTICSGHLIDKLRRFANQIESEYYDFCADVYEACNYIETLRKERDDLELRSLNQTREYRMLDCDNDQLLAEKAKDKARIYELTKQAQAGTIERETLKDEIERVQEFSRIEGAKIFDLEERFSIRGHQLGLLNEQMDNIEKERDDYRKVLETMDANGNNIWNAKNILAKYSKDK